MISLSALALSEDGTTLAAGARYHYGRNGFRSGETRIYKYNSENQMWNLRGSPIDGEAANDNSGFAVSLSDNGHVVAIGARYNDGGKWDDFLCNVYAVAYSENECPDASSF